MVFELIGHKLGQIPDGAYGFVSYHNNVPLEFRNNSYFHVPIVEKTPTNLRLEKQNTESFGQCYLGGIATDDEVYWINDTKPLP